MLEQQKQIQKTHEGEKIFCYHCFNELKTLIVMKKFALVKKDGYWEAEYDDGVKFFCPYCNLEVDIDKLGIKEVIF
jgi:hypothetical protein